MEDHELADNRRAASGFQIAKIPGAVRRKLGTDFEFEVASQSSELWYDVDLEMGTCTCPDHAKGYQCKHIIAARITARAELLEQQKPIPVEIPVRSQAARQTMPA